MGSESKDVYSHKNPFKFLTSSLEWNRFEYSNAYILVTGNITVVRASNNTKVAHHSENVERNKWDFYWWREHVNKVMSLYNLIEYNDNYSDNYHCIQSNCT